MRECNVGKENVASPQSYMRRKRLKSATFLEKDERRPSEVFFGFFGQKLCNIV